MMKTWFEFTIEWNSPKYSTLPKIFKIPIEIGTNIIDDGVSHLQDMIFEAYFKNYQGDYSLYDLKNHIILENGSNPNLQLVNTYDQLRDIVVPKYVVLDICSIMSVVETGGCTGCIYDSSAQKDHMDCPNGCLHEIDECVICNVSNLIK